MSTDLEIAIEAARRAEDLISERFDRVLQSSKRHKIDKIASETDTEAEQIIVDVLRSNTPYCTLGEESGWHAGSSARCWVVDPLDGTDNFVRGLGFFATSIALMRGKDIILGVVLNPISNDLFHAESGAGAYLNGARLSVTSMRTMKTNPLIFLNSGHPSTARARSRTLFDRLHSWSQIRILGPTALELCLLARGAGDSFICSEDKLWDHAAGICIVREAGGTVTDWRGDPWHTSNHFVLASNGSALHEKLVYHTRDLQIDGPDFTRSDP